MANPDKNFGPKDSLFLWQSGAEIKQQLVTCSNTACAISFL